MTRAVDSCAWDAYGYKIRFEWSRPEYKEIVDAVVVPDWVPVTGESEPDAVFSLSGKPDSVWIELDGEEVIGGISFESSKDNLRRPLQLHLATFCQRYLFVHAGVVLAPGGLIVVPGSTFAGKSTLVRALLDRGCTYFSDEFALLDAEGKVSAFPRPMRERTGDHSYRFTPAGDLGWTPEVSAAKPTLVLSTRFEEYETWSPRVLSSGHTVLKLMEHTVAAKLNPERAVKILTSFVSDGLTCLDGPRGEASQTLDILEQVFPMGLK